jgi:hypothetical protein
VRAGISTTSKAFYSHFKPSERAIALVGTAGRAVSEAELQELVQSTEIAWDAIDPHNAMELFSILARSLGQSNAAAYIGRAIAALQSKPTFAVEVSRNSAAHCLVGAVLVNDRPALLSVELIRSQAKYLSSYSPSNCGYNADEIETLKRHLAPHL